MKMVSTLRLFIGIALVAAGVVSACSHHKPQDSSLSTLGVSTAPGPSDPTVPPPDSVGVPSPDQPVPESPPH